MIRYRRPAVLLAVMATQLWATACMADEARLPATAGRVDFERHIAPLLSRYGCNAGSCHGSSEGQGGFKLSLFGSDMRADYAAMVDPGSGRVDLDDPASSLLLQKPSLLVDHDGGLRFSDKSRAFQLLLDWIQEGARHVPGGGRLLDVECIPRRAILDENSTLAVKVVAHFADGTQEEVTQLCELWIRDETVASIDASGNINRVGPGDTAMIAVYRGRPASMSLLVPYPRNADSGNVRPSTALDDPPSTIDQTANAIDHFVSHKLALLRMEPSAITTDIEFLRRVTLATIGQLPTPDEIRCFVADSAADKRTRKIDSLLSHPLHASLWATRMCEITGSRDLEADRMQEADRLSEWKWHEWLRRRFAENRPYDEIIRGILCATSQETPEIDRYLDAASTAAERSHDVHALASHYSDRHTLDLFWRRPLVNEEIKVEELTERISAAFLGIRIECARCHKHPFDRWTQNDHRSLTNIFTQVRWGMSPRLRAAMVDRLEQQREARGQGAVPRRIPSIREIYITSRPADKRDAASQEKLPPRPPGGDALPKSDDRRDPFADWLTSAENPYFARNFVNRVWAWYFSVGLVEPVDAFSAANPATHPELLDWLAREFVDSGFDIKRLEKQILTSHAWQRTSLPTPTNRSDRRNFARFYVVPLRAEAVVDALQAATGNTLEAVPPSTRPLRAVEMPVARTGDETIDLWFEVFNRPRRQLTCDCEQQTEPTLRQTMLLLSDSSVLSLIRQGSLRELVSRDPTDDQLVDEIFLRTVSRWPDPAERTAAEETLRGTADRWEAAVDIMWSLINTSEFITNH